MKKLFVLFTLIALGSGVYAQGRFSVGAELAAPQGDWSDFVSLGFGGSVRYEAPLSDNINWMGTAGFLSFGENYDSGVKGTMIPVLLGGKYYFKESFHGFYAGAELGLSFSKFESDIDEESSTDFSFAPLLGYHFGKVDVSARYLLIEDANSIGFRIAYVFGGE